MAEQVRAHLSDLFRKGEDVTVTDSDGNDFPIYVMRPSGLQQESAREHANAKVARYKLQARDKKSDVYMTMKLAMDDTEYEDAIESLVKFDEPEIRDGALNFVLHNEDSEWKDDKYMSILEAMTLRMQDIEKYNEQMEEGGSEDRIDPEEDDELQEVMAEYQRFQGAVEELVEKELSIKGEAFSELPEEEMRKQLLEKTFDLDTRMQWYEAYQIRMLAYGCRYAEDHKKLYFESPDDVYELPMYVRQQLFDAYERVERGSEEVKNSLSLLSS